MYGTKKIISSNHQLNYLLTRVLHHLLLPIDVHLYINFGMVWIEKKRDKRRKNNNRMSD